ncbi:threonine/serine exporter family protein [Lentibacillus saliphilus]|uniref:threonine/serine exporter family protein n=1 Tax=Lentibacillus saliphilus TaxID=2737028 RepID=UPI001C2F3195|nr:threonine/serine exporter family protein [Lentibacillus saliphilus]
MTNQDKLVQVCMLAGKIMLESGAETYRVEDTMNRMAHVYGLMDVQSYAAPTAIHFSTDRSAAAHFMRISNRSNDLQKIADVNHISRQFTAGTLTLEEALDLLHKVEHHDMTFSYWTQILAAALVSGAFAIMFGGGGEDFLPALIAGGVGYGAMLIVNEVVRMRFVADFFSSVVIGALAIFMIHYGLGASLEKVIIGAVMPLVPGLHITNAVRDLLAGHLVAGVSKGMEATLTAFAIGAGVAVPIAFM